MDVYAIHLGHTSTIIDLEMPATFLPWWRGTRQVPIPSGGRVVTYAGVDLQAQIFSVQTKILSLQQVFQDESRMAGGGRVMQPHSCGYQRTTALWDLQGIWSILDAKLAASGLSGFMGLYKGGRGLATLWTEEYRQKFHTKSLWPQRSFLRFGG